MGQLYVKVWLWWIPLHTTCTSIWLLWFGMDQTHVCKLACVMSWLQHRIIGEHALQWPCGGIPSYTFYTFSNKLLINSLLSLLSFYSRNHPSHTSPSQEDCLMHRTKTSSLPNRVNQLLGEVGEDLWIQSFMHGTPNPCPLQPIYILASKIECTTVNFQKIIHLNRNTK